MPTLTVPPRYYGGLASIRQLSTDSLEKLIEALARAPVTSNAQELTKSVEASLSVHSDTFDAAKIIETVVALSIVRAQADVSVKVFVRDLRKALSEATDASVEIPPGEVAAFEAVLTKLLRIGRLETISKAVSLRADFENTFCDSKILTDIRPVFGASVEEMPVAMVVTHTLKIEYHQGSRHRDFYVELDSEDINKLMEALVRAGHKANTLGKFLKTTDIPDLKL